MIPAIAGSSSNGHIVNIRMEKARLAYGIFFLTLLYIITPWIFERYLLFNEILSAAGLFVFIYKGLRFGRDPISIAMIMLMGLGFMHAVVSLARMDSLYYYLRNAVILYSMFTFFLGYYLLKYLPGFLNIVKKPLGAFIGIFLFIPLPRILFERFGMATLFPALFRKARRVPVHYLLLGVNVIYGITYSSLTAWIIAAFYFILFISPGYRFFKQVICLLFIAFLALFIYLMPYLALIKIHYSYYTYTGMSDVMRSNYLLGLDGNNTWRLVLWRQVLIDQFPKNLFGLGFGTPMIKYFPIEDYTKLQTLPYLVGAHNSFIYLFGRLGIGYILLIVPIYIQLFREYFYHKTWYYRTKEILLFWSFFAATIIALFNPALESPIYAGAYWLLLGFVARAIHNRHYNNNLSLPGDAHPLHP